MADLEARTCPKATGPYQATSGQQQRVSVPTASPISLALRLSAQAALIALAALPTDGH